jgi:DNA-binding LytR/AlgR family response regulator
MSISCMIIDDEPLARKGLKEYIADTEFLKLEAEADSALAAIDQLNTGNIQLLFLDIQMPKMTGIELLRSLSQPPLVILTTAFPQYALEGFELDVVDYLVKPISFPRFLKAAMKAKEQLQGRINKINTTPSDDHCFIKTDNALVKIPYVDILFAEAMENYVAIHTREKKYIAHLTFRTLEEKLPAADFLKVHKSYIVNLTKIEGIDTEGLMIGGHKIPISRTSKEAVMDLVLKGKLLKR